MTDEEFAHELARRLNTVASSAPHRTALWQLLQFRVPAPGYDPESRVTVTWLGALNYTMGSRGIGITSKGDELGFCVCDLDASDSQPPRGPHP